MNDGAGHVAASASRIGPSLSGEDQASRLRAMVGQTLSAGQVNQVAMGQLGRAITDGAREGEPMAWRRAGHAGVPIVAITSGKGGVGKTNLAVNLSIALSTRRARVTLLDADLGMANTDVLLGMTPTRRIDAVVGNSNVGNMNGAGRGVGSLAGLCVEAPGGFRLIPGSAGVARIADLPRQSRAAMIDALSTLSDSSDVVLIDTGAGAHAGVTSFVRAADLALVVVTPEPTSIADAYAMVKCLTDAGRMRENMPRVMLVVNQARDEEEARAVHARIAAVSARFLGAEPGMFGWVPSDAGVSMAVRARTPFVLREPRGAASLAVMRLAEALEARLMPRCAEHAPNEGGWLARILRGLAGHRGGAVGMAR